MAGHGKDRGPCCFGGCHFCGALVGASPAPDQLATHAHLDFIGPLVGRPGFLDDTILGCDFPVSLHQLLEASFVVIDPLHIGSILKAGRDQLSENLIHGPHPTVEVCRSNQGFECIGQVGSSLLASALLLAPTEK